MSWPFQTKQQTPRTAADLSAELQQLEDEIIERGIEAGMRKLDADDYPAIVEGRLQVLSAKRFGTAGPEPALLMQQETELRQERQEIEKQLQARRPQFVARLLRQDSSPVAPSPVNWRTSLVSITAVFALIGLGLESVLGAMGWRGWASLALMALVLAANLAVISAFIRKLSSWPLWADSLTHLYRDHLEFRRVRAQAAELDQLISLAKQRRVAEIERRQLAQEWVAQVKELVMSQYAYQQSRGAAAARLAGES